MIGVLGVVVAQFGVINYLSIQVALLNRRMGRIEKWLGIDNGKEGSKHGA